MNEYLLINSKVFLSCCSLFSNCKITYHTFYPHQPVMRTDHGSKGGPLRRGDGPPTGPQRKGDGPQRRGEGAPAGPQLRVAVVRRADDRQSYGFAMTGGQPPGAGYFVSGVTPGSPAHTAGVKVGVLEGAIHFLLC